MRGSLLSPQEAATRSRACRAGALSAQECSTGVIIIGRGRKDGLSDGLGEGDLVAGGRGAGFGGFGFDASPLPPITVPVSALLTGAGGSFRLTDVFRVTPGPPRSSATATSGCSSPDRLGRHHQRLRLSPASGSGQLADARRP